jgi:alkanesulfonate monooxygenase SsuD/methylene tetrahydromethanopterin reductase-like flavin-dependent oxidoreductase (luciferase family)
MRYGFVLPGGTARQSIDRAAAAEEAGWDAVFLAEGPFIEDPWVILGAVAERTSTIRL